MNSSSEGVRYCAVQWALRIFETSDFSARYVCILATADHKQEVREAGLKGLDVKKDDSGTGPSSYQGMPPSLQRLQICQSPGIFFVLATGKPRAPKKKEIFLPSLH